MNPDQKTIPSSAEIDELALCWLARRYHLDLHGQAPTGQRVAALVADARDRAKAALQGNQP